MDFEDDAYETDPPEWLERSDDYNVWEERQLDLDRDAGEYDLAAPDPDEDDEDDDEDEDDGEDAESDTFRVERILHDSNIVWPRYGDDTVAALARRIVDALA